jgi:hypothetical protein
LIEDFFTNIKPGCKDNECTYTFKDPSGNVMAIPEYIGTGGLDPNKIPSKLSGEWGGYISCRTDSQ